MLIAWIALTIFFAIVELSTPQLVSIWFALASLFSLIALALGAEPWLQIVVFAISSVALLFLTRPLYRKHLKPKIVKTNTDAVIEQEGIVTIDIDNDQAVGQIKVKGQYWSASSLDGSIIKIGEKVVVNEISGVKAIVIRKE